MKQFKTISTTFIIVISIISGCNVFYLISLYNSIRDTVERDVMTALADANLDELWERAAGAEVGTTAQIDSANRENGKRHGEISTGAYPSGNIATTTKYADGTTETQNLIKNDNQSFNNLFAQVMGRQFHAVMDPYVEVDLSVMDRVMTKQLNDRQIYPDYISTEIINGKGEVIKRNTNYKDGSYDVFTYCFNPDKDQSYRVYMTPLTRHIFSEMSGVIITVFLLMVSFALAFLYLFRTVSRLRTIEEMKDDFVSNMTHELKTPIAIAYSANDSLLNYDADNDTEKKDTYLKIANKQLKRLEELVENILAMSMERRKSMPLKQENIQLLPFIEEIASSQRLRGEKDITIEVLGADNITVISDKVHLANVLNNLIDNAIMYSGNNVHIVIKCVPGAITVSDNGIGIPVRSIPHLFDKFYRVPQGNRQDVRGYGIGLYYVKNILDKMGWTISVMSCEGYGSVFTIKFGGDER